MDLFGERLAQGGGDMAGRLSALEEYVEYLRQQGSYGFSQTGRRLEALEDKKTNA